MSFLYLESKMEAVWAWGGCCGASGALFWARASGTGRAVILGPELCCLVVSCVLCETAESDRIASLSKITSVGQIPPFCGRIQ